MTARLRKTPVTRHRLRKVDGMSQTCDGRYLTCPGWWFQPRVILVNWDDCAQYMEK